MSCKNTLIGPRTPPCPYCRIDELEQQLADEQQDCADLALQVAKLEQQLSRYQGAVEVEGYANTITIELDDHLPNSFVFQRVRVLVKGAE